MVETKTKTKTAKPKKESTAKAVQKLVAVVRIRGSIGVTRDIESTMKLLRLHKKHRCVVVPLTSNYSGMLNKVKDYCTFGEVDETTVKTLLQKRGKIVGDKILTEDFLKNNKLTFDTFTKKLMAHEIKVKDVSGLKQFFKLHPPIGGFERGGIKKPFSMHGALGYRGADINKLLRRMM